MSQKSFLHPVDIFLCRLFICTDHSLTFVHGFYTTMFDYLIIIWMIMKYIASCCNWALFENFLKWCQTFNSCKCAVFCIHICVNGLFSAYFSAIYCSVSFSGESCTHFIAKSSEGRPVCIKHLWWCKKEAHIVVWLPYIYIGQGNKVLFLPHHPFTCLHHV